MINFLKKYFILIFLSFLVGLLIVIKLIYGNSKVEEIIEVTPTPTVMVEDENNLQEGSLFISYDPKYPLKKYLPYQGVKIRIEKYAEPNVLEILIKSEEGKIEAEKELKVWLYETEIERGEDTYIFSISDN